MITFSSWTRIVDPKYIGCHNYEKNLCENVLKTIFGIKDTLAIQKDLKECGIHHICGCTML